MKRWDQPKYQKIVAVLADMGVLDVQFANGDKVTVLIRELIPSIDVSQAWDITNKDLRMNAREVTVRYEGQEIAIPWDAIRFRTDEGFAEAMCQIAEQQNKTIGATISRLRQQKGVSLSELAEAIPEPSGIEPEDIAAIEGGKQASFATLRAILVAMGFSLKDLVVE